MKLSQARFKYPGSETFTFGDSKELCDELTLLVIDGKKIATCEALDVYESGGEKMPKEGRVDIALTWEGTPAVAIQTIQVEIKRFIDVDEEFALAEGENDDLAGWQRCHKEYFERSGRFDADMKLVCERFKVIEVFV